MVGSLSAQEAAPLAKPLATFLDQGLPQGHAAVYVSMGTLARLAEKTLTSIAAALSALPNPVLWSLQQTALPGALVYKYPVLFL